MILQEKNERYQRILDQQLSECIDKKYIIYNSEIKECFTYCDDGSCYPSDIHLKFYFSDLTKENDGEEYHTKFTFKYYILIKENIYKKFKKLDSHLNILFSEYYDTYRCTDTISKSAKFLKPYYNKETINKNGIKYIKIKLRSLNNTFAPTGHLIIDQKYKNLCDENIFNNDIIKLIAIPVKKNIQILSMF